MNKWALGIAAAIIASAILATGATLVRHESRIAVMEYVITNTIPEMAIDIKEIRRVRTAR